MRFSYLLLALALVVAPAPVVAQATQEPASRPVVREALEQRSPVNTVLKHREAWGLTPDQVTRLEEIHQRMVEQNRPLVRQLLEIRSAPGAPPKVRPEEMTPEQRQEWQRRVEQARPIMRQIHQNNHRAMDEVRAVLNPAQREQLREWLKERHKLRGDHDGRRGGHGVRPERTGASRGRPN